MTKTSAEIRDPSPLDAGSLPSRGALGLDLLSLGGLLALAALVLLPGALSLPMELWDESRLAANAIEMAQRGDWVVTTYLQVPDHWNTKPPLMIWAMAVLLRTGADPMLAIRLPALAATLGTVALVWIACRRIARDRWAGLIAGVLLVASPIFMGNHAGRTGDYDAVLCLLNLGFVLASGLYIDAEGPKPKLWVFAAAGLLVLAVLTKGVAGGLAVPGLAAYALIRQRLPALLADRWLWLSLAAGVLVVGGWFGLREQLDPGYLAAVWQNDIGGRMISTLEDHRSGRTFYVRLLLREFQPAVLFMLLLLVMPKDPDPARRRLCLLTSLAALSWLMLISISQTKLSWYVMPMQPLAAIAVGVAVTTWLGRWRSWPASSSLRRAMIGLPILVSVVVSFWYLNVFHRSAADASDQAWYGPFMADVRAHDALGGAFIVDGGFPNGAGFEHYNPIAHFFVEDATRRGERLTQVANIEALPADAALLTCDPAVRGRLAGLSSFAEIRTGAHCVFGRLSGTGR
jgi:4-amino-4-deoxy-L-arabinose transferase-like glycosyltransferase